VFEIKFYEYSQSGSELIGAYRSSKSSQKQSKSADMDQTGYAIEKVTRTLSRIIDLKISNPSYIFFGHFGHFWPF
jgi:5'-3' exonuclease